MSQAVDSWSKEMFAAAVCRLLRDSRRAQKLTQAQVAARTGGLISKAALANYETGHRSLRVDVLWVIAKALGENIGNLVANAERGIGHRQDADGGSPITIDIEEMRENGDERLSSVRRWIELQQTARQSSGGVMTLDTGAIAALSSLMGVTPPECRTILMTVAGRFDTNGTADRPVAMVPAQVSRTPERTGHSSEPTPV
ncbi:transcriptional regulator with XRE-family HTH domain [Nakamurella sp. UYEF19]|uniref:helix-turn-helix domain-containing protein n=1 Tax=Nakamurella sp. UYEF19 TaxID=1756392 RepID=UPI0033996529